MRRTGVVLPGFVTALTLGALLASSAAASAALVLKGGGQVAPVGTPVLGMLRFGPCGTFESTGALTRNNSAVDVAKFSSTEGGGFGCGEGGPIITGSVSADKLSETGQFVVATSLTYTTTFSGFCSYALRRLHGKYAIPGGTQASVSGTGKVKPENSSSCPEHVRVTGVEAKLYDSDTNELFQAELSG